MLFLFLSKALSILQSDNGIIEQNMIRQIGKDVIETRHLKQPLLYKEEDAAVKKELDKDSNKEISHRRSSVNLTKAEYNPDSGKIAEKTVKEYINDLIVGPNQKKKTVGGKLQVVCNLSIKNMIFKENKTDSSEEDKSESLSDEETIEQVDKLNDETKAKNEKTMTFKHNKLVDLTLVGKYCKGMTTTCCSSIDLENVFDKINDNVVVELAENVKEIYIFKKLMNNFNPLLFRNMIKANEYRVKYCTKVPINDYAKFFLSIAHEFNRYGSGSSQGNKAVYRLKTYYENISKRTYELACRFCIPEELRQITFSQEFRKYDINYNLMNSFKLFYDQFIFDEFVFKVNLMARSFECIFNHEEKSFNLNTALGYQKRALEIINKNEPSLINRTLPKIFISFFDSNPFVFEYIDYFNLNMMLTNLSENNSTDEYVITKRINLLNIYDKTENVELESNFISTRFIKDTDSFMGTEDIEMNLENDNKYTRGLSQFDGTQLLSLITLLLVPLTLFLI